MSTNKHSPLLKRVLLFVFVIMVLAFPLTVYAHSGDTDSSGGHYDHENGGYHYHCGGHPAHQHTGGICPYKGSSSKPGSSGNGSGSSFAKYNNPEDNSMVWVYMVVIAVVLFLCYKTYRDYHPAQSTQPTTSNNIISTTQIKNSTPIPTQPTSADIFSLAQEITAYYLAVKYHPTATDKTAIQIFQKTTEIFMMEKSWANLLLRRKSLYNEKHIDVIISTMKSILSSTNPSTSDITTFVLLVENSILMNQFDISKIQAEQEISKYKPRIVNECIAPILESTQNYPEYPSVASYVDSKLSPFPDGQDYVRYTL